MVRRRRHWRRPGHHRLWHPGLLTTRAPTGRLPLVAVQSRGRGVREEAEPALAVVGRCSVDVLLTTAGYIPQLRLGEHRKTHKKQRGFTLCKYNILTAWTSTAVDLLPVLTDSAP